MTSLTKHLPEEFEYPEQATREESPRKRRRLSDTCLESDTEKAGSHNRRSSTGNAEKDFERSGDEQNDNGSVIPASNLAGKNIAPFITRHIRDLYAPMNRYEPTEKPNVMMSSNSRYCYRHRPDLKCRRQADELSMDQLQNVCGNSNTLV